MTLLIFSAAKVTFQNIGSPYHKHAQAQDTDVVRRIGVQTVRVATKQDNEQPYERREDEETRQDFAQVLGLTSRNKVIRVMHRQSFFI